MNEINNEPVLIPSSVMLTEQLQMPVQPIADGGIFDFATNNENRCAFSISEIKSHYHSPSSAS